MSQFIPRDGGEPVGVDTLRRLVKRVMDDGGMDRLRACVFVAGMFRGVIGWNVLMAIDGDSKGGECSE